MRTPIADRPPGRLGLFSVYVRSTGAMIGAGFFLLPGFAATQAGGNVALAYLLAGVLIVPSLLSKAELATAMPKAGGASSYLDRTLGPMVGTIGGVATWLTHVLKAGFALIAIGAYLGLVLDLRPEAIAIATGVILAVIGVTGLPGARRALPWVVLAVVLVLVLFVVSGLVEVSGGGAGRPPLQPFALEGGSGVLTTIGVVVVAYIGLTHVAGLTERLERPARDLPLGMGLALATVTALYTLGVFVMVATLGADSLSGSLTPMVAAAEPLMSWLPPGMGRWLIVASAVAACAVVANNGIQEAARHPLGAVRDRLSPNVFAILRGPSGPMAAAAMTVLIMAGLILTIDILTFARLAGAMHLLLFGLINVAVIVLRESRIDSSPPVFRSPLYPWLQLSGIFVSLVLVAELGWFPVLFTAGVTAACFGWYNSYGRKSTTRDGAIVQVMERLSRRRIMGLDRELRDIIRERAATPPVMVVEESFDDVVARALVIDRPEQTPLSNFIREASVQLAPTISTTAERLENLLVAGLVGAPVARGAALLHARLHDFDGSELLIARCAGGVRFDLQGLELTGDPDPPVHALFFLISDDKTAGRHLRILARLAGRVEDSAFMRKWLDSRHGNDLKATLRRQ